MYATIRLFKLNPIFERDFIRYWHKIVDDLQGLDVLSSATLHKESKISYVSYVIWKSQNAFEEYKDGGKKEKIEADIETMNNFCNSILLLYRMEVVGPETTYNL